MIKFVQEIIMFLRDLGVQANYYFLVWKTFVNGISRLCAKFTTLNKGPSCCQYLWAYCFTMCVESMWGLFPTF